MKKLFFTLPLVLVISLSVTGYSFAQEGSVSATVRPNPLKVEVFAPSGVTVGQWFNIEAEVSNLGTEAITKTHVLISTPSELKVRRKRKRIGNLGPGATEPVIWQAKINQASSSLVIQVEASGKLGSEEIFASDSTIIPATGSLGAFLFRLIFGV